MYGCSFKCGGYLPPLPQTPGELLAVSSESEDVDCLWQVHFPKSQKINFDFINFKLPCKYGHVDVRGSSPYYGGAQRLGDFCDYISTPPPIESSGNKLWIRFQSNSSDPLVGFYGIYFPNCDTFLNSTKGTINSPNYPKLYNHNSKCTWSITVPKGNVVMLKFLDIDIEEDPACKNDYVAVLDSNSSTIGQYCNSIEPPRLICSSENTMKLHFKSDDVLALKGFQATYEAIHANAPCMEPSSTIITPTPTISIPTSVASINYTPSPTIVAIKPTAVAGLSPTLMRNGTLGVLATGTGVQSTGLGNFPLNKKDDDDEDTGLTTIIIIAVFSFIVLCMIVVSVIPSMIHGYEKRKRERAWALAAALALKKNSCIENEYEMQLMKTQADKKTENEPNEETAFLDPEDPCFDEQETVLFLPITPQENHETSTPCNRTIIEADEIETCADGPVAEDLGCELEYDTTDLSLTVSYEDLGSSFATEMAALMNNYDYISPNPKQDPSVCGVLQETNEDLESCTDTEVLHEDKVQNGDTRKIQSTNEKNKETEESADGKLQKALSDLKATLSQINSDSESIPEIENPETCTNSTASVRGSQDMPSIPTVWEKSIPSGDDSSNPRRTRNSGDPDVRKTSNDGAQSHVPELEVNKDSGHCSSNSDYDQVPNIPNYSLTSIATETYV
ncbi:hypothetical protein QZH41_003303 [Actinostola sp. cb2023]|nr:hypothetical protein QZH41_003303 [Actinostola sp. cb2023]